jgi:hypothetical protein
MLIEINGAVVGFLVVFFVPIVLHIKCVFFSKKAPNGEIVVEREEDGAMKVVESSCKCSVVYMSEWRKYLELLFQLLLLSIGSYTIFYTLKEMFWGTE